MSWTLSKSEESTNSRLDTDESNHENQTNQSKCSNHSTLINNGDTQLAVMFNDNEVISENANTTFSYLQQISQLGQQQLFLQQQPQLLVETKSPDLLDHLYRSNELQLIESKKDNDPHNLLIISKGDQHETFKGAIIDEPLLPLHTNLPLLNNQNESLLTASNQGLCSQLDILNKQSEFTYDTLKHLQLDQSFILPAFQSTMEDNIINLMNSGSVLNTNSDSLTKQKSYNAFDSPYHKAYISKNNIDNDQIIYSTIANNNSIELNNSISLVNGNAIQLSNQSNIMKNTQEHGLMSVNNPTIYTTAIMNDKSSEQLPFVSKV